MWNEEEEEEKNNEKTLLEIKGGLFWGQQQSLTTTTNGVCCGSYCMSLEEEWRKIDGERFGGVALDCETRIGFRILLGWTPIVENSSEGKQESGGENRK
ncbi:hypothetical protein J1N35_040292 [Gossypium stocksii]|uniref:Uncharacterized protein n=1 Tax=Gossypium stocksii TaxID=47602 RepID=A0A9D3ZIP5_9ROSI|nr:hypothetical protein J1N35_040292 [Gossypium stocksii]